MVAETDPSGGSSVVAALFAEFIGTFVVVFAVGCNALTSTSGAMWGPSAVALAVMVLAYAFGSVSGGLMNPAVTFAAGLTRKLSWHRVLAYIVAQVAAGLVAAFSCTAIFRDDAAIHSAGFGPQASFHWWEVMIVEALYTALLAFVVLSCAYSQLNNPMENRNQFYGLAYGFAVLAGAYGCHPISGDCAFNPAVSLGLSISSYARHGFSTHGFEYTGYQVLGSLLAALLFKLTRPEDFHGATAGRPSQLQDYKASLATKLAAEFLGTFMLTLTLGLSTMAAATGDGGDGAAPLSCGALVLCMSYAVCDISGGFFNPAVTFAAVLSRKVPDLSPLTGLFYVLFQVMGAILAALLYAGLYRSVTFPLAPKEPFTIMASYVIEFIFTLSTAFVALSTVCVKGVTSDIPGRNYYFGLAYGFSVAVAGLAGERISGGFVNPAATFGLSLADTVTNAASLYYCATFVLSQLFGALASALIFYVTHAKEYATPKFTDRSLFAAQAQ